MKTLVLVALLVIAGCSYAGTLTIVPDSTSSMGKQKQIDDEIDRRRAAKRARIDAGLEPAPVRPIIIQQRPRYQDPPRTNFTCRPNGVGGLSCY